MTDPGSLPRAARNRWPLANVARALKLIALLLFLLPWVTVSCADQTLVSMSGLDLATGSVTVHNPISGEITHPPDSGRPDWPVLIAALLIVAALVISFVVRVTLAALGPIGALAAAAGLIAWSVLVRIPDKARADASTQTVEGLNRTQIHDLIRVETAAGFWLTLAALASAIVVSWMARDRAP
jgi:hypothetical protein